MNKKIMTFLLITLFSSSAKTLEVPNTLGLLQGEKEKYLAYLKSRLAIYEPQDITLTAWRSLRKIIKNAIIPGNGYYEIKFYSKRYQSNFKCDVTYARNLSPGQLYILNCKDDRKDYMALKEQFMEQVPTNGDPNSIEFDPDYADNTLKYLLLIDESSHRVSFKNKEGEKLECELKVDMNLARERPLLVDQEMRTRRCRVVNSKIPENYISPTCLNYNIHQTDAIDLNVGLLNKMYDFYSKKLDEKWPLPKVSADDCKKDDVKMWQEYADQLVDMDQLKENGEGNTNATEYFMLKNALINQAYNRLYMHHKNSSGVDYLKWLSVASFSSPVVGKSIRKSYVENLGKNQDLSFGAKNVYRHDSINAKKRSQLLRFVEKREEVAILAGQGNNAVREDQLWQNLAAAYCGPGKAKELARKLRDDKDLRAFTSYPSEHYDKLAKAWELIEKGVQEKDQDIINQGNIKLLEIEQTDTLQKMMYETTEAKIVHSLGIFNSLAQASLYDAQGKELETFDEFTKKKRMNNKLHELKSRVEWMKYVTRAQIESIQKANENGALKPLFLPNLNESYLILSDYDNYKGRRSLPSGSPAPTPSPLPPLAGPR